MKTPGCIVFLRFAALALTFCAHQIANSPYSYLLTAITAFKVIADGIGEIDVELFD